jgi:DNA mismatch repair protein MutL
MYWSLLFRPVNALAILPGSRPLSAIPFGRFNDRGCELGCTCEMLVGRHLNRTNRQPLLQLVDQCAQRDCTSEPWARLPPYRYWTPAAAEARAIIMWFGGVHQSMGIRVLDPSIAAKIAAGEVVERPSSAVKELVENALDAGARRVGVEIRGGGRSLIRVSDDGAGIPRDDVPLAFERHATSKISSVADLLSVKTLGFRGEALPSIAAVSDVVLRTCFDGQESGVQVRAQGGNVGTPETCSYQRGTIVTVTDLFRYVPARLKFLRSDSTEAGHVHTMLSRFAIGYPEVAFKLTSDGRQVLNHDGGTLFDALVNVYGLETARDMIPVSSDSSDSVHLERGVLLHGFTSPPSVSRATRNCVSLFVNRRVVYSRILIYAVDEAYRGLLMEHRFPVAVLHLDIPLDEVDVNVHPAKSEVRFRREREVYSVLQRAVRLSLSRFFKVPEIAPQLDAATSEHAQQPMDLQEPLNRSAFLSFNSQRLQHTDETFDSNTRPLSRRMPVVRVLGQFASTYVIAEGPDGIYMIDQHTAHERILFEQFKAQSDASSPASQMLLEPLTWHVGPIRSSEVEQRLVSFTGLGFRIEQFGDGVYLIRAIPSMLRPDEVVRVLDECLEQEIGQGEQDCRERSLKVLVCHSAVRAGQTMSHEEMRQLVYQLEAADLPYTCPHGRPTMLHMTQAWLERAFYRR